MMRNHLQAVPGLTLIFLFGAQLIAASCPVQYDEHEASRATPLLFGGTYSTCTAGCEPREGVWSDICKLDPDAYTAWGVCEDWQRQHLYQLAANINGGEMLRFSPCQLYEVLGNRTLWVMGDSHVKGLFYSLRCFMMDFFDHSRGECAASSDAALQEQLELVSLQGHPYNTPPRCLHMKGSRGRICMVHSPIGDYYVSADHAQAPGTLELLAASFTDPDDVVFAAFGRWHANNCEGVHPSYTASLERLGTFVHANRAKLPNVLFGVTPHDHTKCVGHALDFDVPACLPAEQGGYNLSIGFDMSAITHSILGKYNIPVVDVYNESYALFDGHITAAQSIAGVIDCLHFCRPSWGEINLWTIYRAMAALQPSSTDTLPSGSGPVNDGLPQSAERPCVFVAPVLPKPFGPPRGTGAGVGGVRMVWEDVWGYTIPADA